MQANGHDATAAPNHNTVERDTATEGARGPPRAPQSAPLSLVVSDAVRRWYADAHRDALKGDVVRFPQFHAVFPADHTAHRAAPHALSLAAVRDVIATSLNPLSLCWMQKQQALLGEMMREGYGCERDPVGGQEWAAKARRRGYSMSGVYCEL